jgi:hypothetical protein
LDFASLKPIFPKVEWILKAIYNIPTMKLQRSELIGALSILIAIWTIVYLIPDFLSSLLNTVLGNLILLITILLVGSKNYVYGFVLGVTLVILYRISHIKEGFTWSQDSANNFILLQQTLHPGIVFDTTQIKEQASQEELDYFLKNGKWPWSQEVQDLFKEAVQRNPYIRTSPEDAVNQARTVYNQAIILEIISWQTKEGKFLLSGVSIKDASGNPQEDLPSGWGDYGYSSGLIGHLENDVVKCAPDASGNYSLVKIRYTGKDKITIAQTKETTQVDYNDLPNLVPGFKFTGTPCDPCVALNNSLLEKENKKVEKYTCPFQLDISGSLPGVSSVWQYLWNPASVSQESTAPKNEFPVLKELKNELNAMFPTPF